MSTDTYTMHVCRPDHAIIKKDKNGRFVKVFRNTYKYGPMPTPVITDQDGTTLIGVANFDRSNYLAALAKANQEIDAACKRNRERRAQEMKEALRAARVRRWTEAVCMVIVISAGLLALATAIIYAARQAMA